MQPWFWFSSEAATAYENTQQGWVWSDCLAVNYIVYMYLIYLPLKGNVLFFHVISRCLAVDFSFTYFGRKKRRTEWHNNRIFSLCSLIRLMIHQQLLSKDLTRMLFMKYSICNPQLHYILNVFSLIFCLGYVCSVPGCAETFDKFSKLAIHVRSHGMKFSILVLINSSVSDSFLIDGKKSFLIKWIQLWKFRDSTELKC